MIIEVLWCRRKWLSLNNSVALQYRFNDGRIGTSATRRPDWAEGDMRARTTDSALVPGNVSKPSQQKNKLD